MYLKLRHVIAQVAGHLLSMVPMNILEICEEGEEMHCLKKRCWYAALLVFAGNLYLRTIRSHVHILSCHKWFMWECQVYNEIYGKKIHHINNHVLALPYLKGTTLSDILRSKNESSIKKIEAVGLAVYAIKTMHKSQLIWPDGKMRFFSHGDATVKNIICDLSTKTVMFIDFETMHDARMSTDWRHADDLRTIIYSAAEYLEPKMFHHLSLVITDNYGDKSVLCHLKNYIETSKFHPNVYHLAQSNLGFEKKSRLDITLLRTIETVL